MLTVGDGLLSQIPALLNSLAAGMIVTRVTRSENTSLSTDLLNQLGQVKKVKIIIACVALILAFSLGPAAPFLIIAIFLGVSAATMKEDSKKDLEDKISENCEPKNIPVIELLFGKDLARQMNQENSKKLMLNVSQFQQDIYQKTGIFPNMPEVNIDSSIGEKFEVKLRGVSLIIGEVPEDAKIYDYIVSSLSDSLSDKYVELIDDTMTRRLLDKLEEQSPEIVTNTIPDIITVTQLTKIIRTLIEEDISCRNLDMILQAIAEHGTEVSGERELYEYVRCKLARLISSKFASEGLIEVISIDPVLDIEVSGLEQRSEPISQDVIESIRIFLEEKTSVNYPLLCSRRS